MKHNLSVKRGFSVTKQNIPDAIHLQLRKISPQYPHAQSKNLTPAKTPPTSSNLSAPLQTQTSAGFLGPFGDGALQRAAVPITERVSTADCGDARKEGPHYDMMQSIALLGLHDLIVAFQQWSFYWFPVLGLYSLAPAAEATLQMTKSRWYPFTWLSSTRERNSFRSLSAHQNLKCKAN